MARNEVWLGVGVVSLLGLAFVGVFFAGMGASKRQEEQHPSVASKPVPTVPAAQPTPRNADWESLHDQSVKNLLASDSRPVLAANLSGSGAVQSDYFTVTTGDQFVMWSLDPETTMRMLVVRVNDENKRHVDQFIPDAKGHVTGNARLRLAPGTYYFDVTAFGQWKIAIFETP